MGSYLLALLVLLVFLVLLVLLFFLFFLFLLTLYKNTTLGRALGGFVLAHNG